MNNPRHYSRPLVILFYAVISTAVLDSLRHDKPMGLQLLADEKLQRTVESSEHDAEETKPPQDAVEDVPEKEDTPSEEEQSPNFLKQLFERLLLPGRLQQGTPRAAESDSATLRRADPRAPYDARLTSLMKRAQGLIKSGDSRQALEALQRILDQPDDAVWEAGAGKLISLRTAAQRLLGKLPSAELDRYRLQHEAIALQSLQNARLGGGHELAQVASKYFHTKAGYVAADLLAARHIDRGEYALASRRIEELILAKAPVTLTNGWGVRAEFVAHQLNSVRLKKLLLDNKIPIEKSPVIGGKTVEREKFLSGLPRVTVPRTPVLSDWRQAFGTARRVGQPISAEPFLLKRWSLPMTGSTPIQDRLASLNQELRDQDQNPIPCFQPLLVDGKVVFRSLRGVKVADIRTGRVLWETSEEWPVEDILSYSNLNNESDESERDRILVAFAQAGVLEEELEELPVSDHPLTHLLYRNANHGMLSSDGSRLFVIEEQSVMSALQPGQYLGDEIPETDPFGRSLGSNRLTAYDLKSGHRLWELGGPIQNDPFNDPLAGTFFLGPPVVDRLDAYVVGEVDGTLRLFCLNPVTGRVHWSQVIGHAQAKINVDLGRQWLSAQVSVGDGVIVCPSSVGWLVALDRMSKGILWAHRYSRNSATESAEPGDEAVPPAELNERWAPSPPIITGNRVVFVPQTESQVLCLGLSDGKLIWSRARGSGVYLAGVFGESVLVVNEESIHALSLSDGRQLWMTRFPVKDSRPAGMGLALNNHYWVPLTNGQLISVDIQTGKLGESHYLPVTSDRIVRQFGNLGMYQGMLVSLSTEGVVAFEPKQSIETELREQLARNASSWQTIVRIAELELLKRQYESALSTLHRIEAPASDIEAAVRYRTTLRAALSGLVRSDLSSHDVEFEELVKLSVEPTEKHSLEMLRIERLLHRKNYEAAFQTLLKFGKDYQSDWIDVPDLGERVVRGNNWCRGQLQDLWKLLPPDVQSQFDSKVEALATELKQQDVQQRDDFLNLFAFHLASVPIMKQRIDELSLQGEWHAVETELMRMESEPAQFAWARERLGKMALQVGLKTDAAYYFQSLIDDPTFSKLDAGISAARLMNQLRSEKQDPVSSVRDLSDWGNRELQIARAGANYDGEIATTHFDLFGDAPRFFQQYRFQISGQDSRFELVENATESKRLTMPLRNPDGATLQAHAVGHQVYLSDGNHVTAVSPVDGRILWTHLAEHHETQDAFTENSTSLIPQAMFRLGTTSTRNRDGIGDDENYFSAKSSRFIANHYYVAYLNRRTLFVLDARTGVETWRRDGLASDAALAGCPSTVYVYQRDVDYVTAYRAIDGRRMDWPQLKAHAQTAVAVVENDFIVVESTSREGQRLGILKRINPESNTVIWTTEFPAGTLVTPISGMRLIVLDASGKLQIGDLRNGTLRTIAQIPGSSMRKGSRYYAIPTFDQLLLIAHRDADFSDDHYSETFRSLRVSGHVHSFDLKTGKQLWHQAVVSKHLILELLDYSPILLFVSRTFEQNGAGNWRLSLQAIDRLHGKSVLESELSVLSSFHQLNLNLPEEFVELRSYNDRIRLTPGQSKVDK